MRFESTLQWRMELLWMNMENQNTMEKREAGNQQKSGSDQRGGRRLILWLVDLKCVITVHLSFH